MLTVRPYTPTDYEAYVRIDTATQASAYGSEADWEPIHPPRDETPNARRYVAVYAAPSQPPQIVGYGAVLLAESSNLDVLVHPDQQRRGVGTALWERMRQDLLALPTESGSVTVGPWVRAENTAACRWLEALGFSQVHQDGAVQLFVADADLSSAAALTETLADAGISITTLADEKAGNPDCLTQFYELFREVEKDVVGYTPERATPFAQCMAELEQPGVVGESVFIARHGDKYVGLSILGRKVTASDLRFAGPDSFGQHLTGVRREYRRRGIALALKHRTIAYVREHGGSRILSNSDNPAMQTLNAKLGFRTGPWLVYQIVLKPRRTGQ